MSNVTTLEEELELPNVYVGKKPIKSKTGTNEEEPLITKKVVKKTEKSAVDKLTFDANLKLNYYLKKMPQWQI